MKSILKALAVTGALILGAGCSNTQNQADSNDSLNTENNVEQNSEENITPQVETNEDTTSRLEVDTISSAASTK